MVDPVPPMEDVLPSVPRWSNWMGWPQRCSTNQKYRSNQTANCCRQARCQCRHRSGANATGQPLLAAMLPPLGPTPPTVVPLSGCPKNPSRSASCSDPSESASSRPSGGRVKVPLAQKTDVVGLHQRIDARRIRAEFPVVELTARWYCLPRSIVSTSRSRWICLAILGAATESAKIAGPSEK